MKTLSWRKLCKSCFQCSTVSSCITSHNGFKGPWPPFCQSRVTIANYLLRKWQKWEMTAHVPSLPRTTLKCLLHQYHTVEEFLDRIIFLKLCQATDEFTSLGSGASLLIFVLLYLPSSIIWVTELCALGSNGKHRFWRAVHQAKYLQVLRHINWSIVYTNQELSRYQNPSSSEDTDFSLLNQLATKLLMLTICPCLWSS